MAKVPKGRRVERAAVNTVRALFERHDHIVQEIDGQNDFGEDLFITFTDDGLATNDVVRVQVKGGVSWRRANGYAVPVRQHHDTWSNGNVPVFCVVYDPDTELLYWANATEQLRRARRDGARRTVVGISVNAVLDDRTVDVFAGEARRYAGRFRGELAILHQLSEMSGADFDPDDQVLHFVNEHDCELHGDPEDHANIAAEVADRYVIERMMDRLEADPTLMGRSIQVFRSAVELEVGLLEELCTLESDPGVVTEAMAFSRETCEDVSFEALRLVVFYLLERVRIGPPRLPLHEQINIEWRVPANNGGDSGVSEA